MTKREAAVVAAYTGAIIGEFNEMHTYMESVMGRPVCTLDLLDREFRERLRVLAKADFLALEVK